MEYIKGYKFNTQTEALEAIDKCNKYYGIPKSPDDTTKNWCYFETAELNNPVFYYIKTNESLISVLGYDTIFDVVIQEEPTLENN